MNVRSSSLVLACAALLSASSPAMAQPTGDKKKALELYEKGSVQYDLRHWKQAIDLWMSAYEAYNAPEFLFNIAQAHRHEGNCEQALFFYRRYLATKPNAKNRGEVEGFIKELEGTCKPASGPEPGGGATTGTRPGSGTSTGNPAGPAGPRGSSGSSGPSGSVSQSGTGATEPSGTELAETAGGGDTGEDAATEETEGEEIEQSVEGEAERPHLFATRVAVGPSFPSIGDLEVGTLVAVAASIGHPFYLGSVVLEPGALATYTPVPWEVAQNGMSGTAGLTGLLADVGLGYAFLPRLSVRADVGIGVLIFSGLTVEGNPFLDDGFEADGPIPLFLARGALGAEFAITNNFVVYAQPLVLSFSPPGPLRDDIDRITRFEMLVGAGYRM